MPITFISSRSPLVYFCVYIYHFFQMYISSFLLQYSIYLAFGIHYNRVLCFLLVHIIVCVEFHFCLDFTHTLHYTILIYIIAQRAISVGQRSSIVSCNFLEGQVKRNPVDRANPCCLKPSKTSVLPWKKRTLHSVISYTILCFYIRFTRNVKMIAAENSHNRKCIFTCITVYSAIL